MSSLYLLKEMQKITKADLDSLTYLIEQKKKLYVQLEMEILMNEPGPEQFEKRIIDCVNPEEE